MRNGTSVEEEVRPFRVCYFGLSRAAFSRNRVYIEAVRKSGKAEVVECFDESPGVTKYFKLWSLHKKLRHTYDVMVIGYPGQTLVWFAKLIATAPVVLDTIASLYEAEIISRHPEKRYSFLAFRVWLIDFFAYHLADLTCVESEAQVRYFKKLFGVSSKKCRCLYTGADDSVFRPCLAVKKYEMFTVLFRGRFLPEAGAIHVLEAAEILKNEPIAFKIYGQGLLQKGIEERFNKLALPHVALDTKMYPLEELPALMAPCHVSLGQLACHERLKRTIPHKAFESIAMKIPYISARYEAIQELLTEGESALMFAPGNARELANAILELYRDEKRAQELGEAGYRAYHKRASQEVLGREFLAILNETVTARRL